MVRVGRVREQGEERKGGAAWRGEGGSVGIGLLARW